MTALDEFNASVEKTLRLLKEQGDLEDKALDVVFESDPNLFHPRHKLPERSSEYRPFFDDGEQDVTLLSWLFDIIAICCAGGFLYIAGAILYGLA